MQQPFVVVDSIREERNRGLECGQNLLRVGTIPHPEQSEARTILGNTRDTLFIGHVPLWKNALQLAAGNVERTERNCERRSSRRLPGEEKTPRSLLASTQHACL